MTNALQKTSVDVTEDCWDDLLAHLRERVLIPFVGPELVTMEHAGRRATVTRVLAEQLAERYKLAFEWTDGSGLHDVVRALVAVRGRTDSERLYRVVNDLLLEAHPAPPEALRQLAGILDIPLFVTTTFDSLMTQAVDEVRFGGARGTRELWFSPNQSTVEQQKTVRPPSPDEAVVFKLFGRASSTPQYALHDEDVLEWLHALLAETAGLPEWVTYRLRESPLLFLGCRIPDWIGRFLMRLASSTRLSLASKQFFIVGSANAPDSGLADFLQTYCGATRVQVVEADPAVFVAELHQRWLARNPQPEARAAASAPAAAPHGSIFISYVREDAAAARDSWARRSRPSAATSGSTSAGSRPGDRWEEEILGAHPPRGATLRTADLEEHRVRGPKDTSSGSGERRCERSKAIHPPAIHRPGRDRSRVRRQPRALQADAGRPAHVPVRVRAGGPARCEPADRADGGDPRHATEGGGMTAVAESLASRQLDLDNPWPGLDSFEETASDFFHGREAEGEELVRRVIEAPLTVLFGKSGLGKTSLLKAGLFPRMRQRHLLPVYVRLAVTSTAPALIDQVRDALRDTLAREGVDAPPMTDGESLWAYLHRTKLELWDAQNYQQKPVFVFDQFEEVFTLGESLGAAVQSFRADFGDLAENRIPLSLTDSLDADDGAASRLDLRTMSLQGGRELAGGLPSRPGRMAPRDAIAGARALPAAADATRSGAGRGL